MFGFLIGFCSATAALIAVAYFFQEGPAMMPSRMTEPQDCGEIRGDIHVLAVVKGPERYVFLYDDANTEQVLQSLGRFASNPDLSFTWHDAAVLSQRVRQTASQKG